MKHDSWHDKDHAFVCTKTNWSSQQVIRQRFNHKLHACKVMMLIWTIKHFTSNSEFSILLYTVPTPYYEKLSCPTHSCQYISWDLKNHMILYSALRDSLLSASHLAGAEPRTVSECPGPPSSQPVSISSKFPILHQEAICSAKSLRADGQQAAIRFARSGPSLPESRPMESLQSVKTDGCSRKKHTDPYNHSSSIEKWSCSALIKRFHGVSRFYTRSW